jgi:heptose-I-phosphate ethanolaminephosphotransferase
LIGLAALPVVPELGLFVQTRSDLKYFLPICYYEGIVSFLLLIPALLLPRLLARAWVGLAGGAMALATLWVGFYSTRFGARWNLTAHAAAMQTNPGEAKEFLQTFLSGGILAWMALLGAAFAACITINVRASPPRRLALIGWAVLGSAISARGIRNAVHYGGSIIRREVLSPSTSLKFVEASYNKLHPVTLLAMTHFNYLATRDYYLRQYRDVASHREELGGAKPIPGAECPRLIVVVIGESANRLHWSLYGYPKETTPRLEKLAGELDVFSDVISTCAGTLCSIRAMLTTTRDTVPVFTLFSQAGYRTHWLSAQFNQGGNDLELSALVSSCDERVFLNGVYDENLEPLVARAAAQPGRQMIFVNLFGSHVRYLDRYPARFDRFHAADDGGPLRSSYDNSILYTDSVLADMIEALRQRHESACLLYVSDHGEDVLDSRPDRYLFRDETLATDPMYEVPFFVWFSSEYRRGNERFVTDDVASGRGRKVQNRALYQALLDLARLRHPLYDPRESLFSPGYAERVRRVGVEGRVYRGETGKR